jgi:hypothetical protein
VNFRTERDGRAKTEKPKQAFCDLKGWKKQQHIPNEATFPVLPR